MDALFEQERIARMNGDIRTLEEIQGKILSACSNNDEIIHVLRALMNKRKQEPECMKKLVKTVFSTNKDIEFLKELQNKVVEGKIFLEDERIDIAEYIKETLGNNIVESYALIKDIPVETFTTISEKKRSRFLFEQFRLSLLLKKFDEAELVTRKVRKGFLSPEEKVIFLNYCILLKTSQNKFLEAAKLYLELNEVDESKKHIALGSFCCLLSSCLVEGWNIVDEKEMLLKTFYEFKNNDEIVRTYIKKFLSKLLIGFEVAEQISSAISRYTDTIDLSLMKKSILEHNFFAISNFFSKIKIEQMVELMHISEDELIGFISEMVNSKFVDTKINQVDSLVSFGRKKWNDTVDQVLDKIVLASYMIHKESISEK